MTRYAMVADLRRCVGCQTCTAACKETRGTPPGVQWRRVLDIETGEYPDVRRSFVPTGCQHCDEPPCLEVCPSTATRKRGDGIVTIDETLCIGCSACIMACPYEARYMVDETRFAFGGQAMPHEGRLADEARLGVATKCDFCAGRVDAGVAKGLVPGVDPAATPVCAQSCISGALQFGDIDDPESPVSKLLAENRWFRMHEDLGTGPGFYYLWDREAEA
ncbi:MAG: 4Fe-4S dicluster domain-containing protein [Rubrivivax sp.]